MKTLPICRGTTLAKRAMPLNKLTSNADLCNSPAGPQLFGSLIEIDRGLNMKKVAAVKPDFSSLVSNLLIVSAVVAAAAPVLLGDQLVVIVSDVFRQVSILLQELSLTLQKLLG